MKISIIIPTKNEEAWLPGLLSSIKKQTIQPFEIIVADAASTDRTRGIAAGFGARVVEGGLPGPGRNCGAEVATGDVLVFFDADVELSDVRFLEICLSEMRERGLSVATCRVRPLGGTLVDNLMHDAYNGYTLLVEKLWPHAPGFCVLVERNAHVAIGGFDERVLFAEDQDYVARAAAAGFSFGILRRQAVPVSIRRLEKEGRLRLSLKYLYAEYRIRLHGPIRDRLPFEYEFAKFQTRKRMTHREREKT